MTRQTQSQPKTKKTKKESYTAKDIYVLKGLEPVRRRPGMYIGSTGSEGLHHLIWECVDNSVSYDTPIIVRDKGKIKIEKIGKFIDDYFAKNSQLAEKSIKGEAEILRKSFQVEALSFDHQNLKLKFQPVFSLIRHKVNSEIYKITLQNGQQVEITPYHSLFTLKDGQVLPIKGSEIQIGTPIVVPKVLPEVENPIEEIDLIDEFLKLPAQKTENIHLYNIKNLLTGEIYQQLKSALKEKADKARIQHSSNVFYDYKRCNYLPFNLLRRLKTKDVAKIKTQVLIGTRQNPKILLKPKLRTGRYLAELLGIFAAKGCIEKNKNVQNKVVFGLEPKEKNLINYTCFLIRKVFGFKPNSYYVCKTARAVAIDSYLVALVFREIFKTGENSSNKKVPDLIFNLPQSFRERYLIGYLAGDGYPTDVWTRCLINDTFPIRKERAKFSLLGKNKELTSSLSYLLSSLGKSYCFGKVGHKERREYVKVNYKGKIKQASFKPKAQTSRIDFYWMPPTHPPYLYFNCLPFKEVVAKRFKGTALSRINQGQTGISRNGITTLLKERGKLALNTGALKFLNSNLGALRVGKIEKIKYSHPWVYDVSVPNGENFVGGFSPICCHNSLDEAMAGFCKSIEVSLLDGNRIKTVDDGRGIPVDIHPQTKKSALETVMTTLHAGAKFGGKAYQVSGGLHGVGVSVVCALSKYMRAEICRSGEKYVQEYSKGKPTTKMKKIGRCDRRGTTIIFEPDPEIFRNIKFDIKKILAHLRQQAYLTPGVKIGIRDERSNLSFRYNFYFEGGIRSFVKYLVNGAETRHNNVFYVKGEKEGVIVEVAFQYAKEMESLEESFANNIFTGEGGTHLTGFRSALTRTLNDYARKNGFLKEKEENLTGNDVREGIVAVVSVKLKEPQFEGQTKAKLGNPEAKIAVEAILSEGLSNFLEKYPQDAKSIIENCLLSAKARRAAKAARTTVLRKGILEGLTLPGKLADCSSKNPEESELYVVEGDSAGGSAKQARDRRCQAILPLKGKILNTERARLDKILSSKEIKSLIIALGTAIAQDFDISKLRYHRIILMSDADVDGAHIRTLLLTLFFRYFREVIDRGYLYIAQPPLYKIQLGKKIEYAYTDADKEEILSYLKKPSLVKDGKTKKKKSGQQAGKEKEAKISIQRYKGLGEMNPEELWETTMNPANRILLRVSIEDAEAADHTFDVLMGKEVLPRKKFLQARAKEVKNLDI